jgi:hypothetical protein
LPLVRAATIHPIWTKRPDRHVRLGACWPQTSGRGDGRRHCPDLVLTYLLVASDRRRNRTSRQQRAEEAEAERERRAEAEAAADARTERAAAAAADAELVGRPWHFEFRLRVAVGEAVPNEAPIQIMVKGANVWVHEVRLSWKPSQPPIAYWVMRTRHARLGTMWSCLIS